MDLKGERFMQRRGKSARFVGGKICIVLNKFLGASWQGGGFGGGSGA